MSDSLETKTIKSSYGSLLQIPNGNNGVDSTLRTVRDGRGEGSALSLSTTGARVDGDLTVTGSSVIPTYEPAREHVSRTDNPHGTTLVQLGMPMYRWSR